MGFVTLAEVKDLLIREENYGYGLMLRKQKKGLKINPKLFETHKWCYNILLDLYVWKLMTQNEHPPLWVVKPQWEQDKLYHWWRSYFSFLHDGARAK